MARSMVSLKRAAPLSNLDIIESCAAADSILVFLFPVRRLGRSIDGVLGFRSSFDRSAAINSSQQQKQNANRNIRAILLTASGLPVISFVIGCLYSCLAPGNLRIMIIGYVQFEPRGQ
jgi:hypothetical protein